MKQISLTSVLTVVCGLFVTGCASSVPVGSFYTNLKLPVTATDNSVSTKVGMSESFSCFGLVATGDSSIETAKKNGGITKVSHVDWEAENILGFFGKYKVTVYGE